MQDINKSSDEELVHFYKNGDERAFSELYSRYESRLKRLIYFYVPNAEEVDDVYHEVLIRVIRHIDSFNPAKSFSSWIYQIAVNCSKNYIKSSQRDRKIIEKEKFRLTVRDTVQITPEETLIGKYDMTEFNNAVENLKDKFKDVFLLRYDHNMKYTDISRVLNCSERTAKWRMEKAIGKITQYLKDRSII